MVERRSHTALVRLTDEEWGAWERAARAAGYGRTAAWVREVVAGAVVGGVQGSSGDDAGARVVAGQIARVGSNLNQIARALNAVERGGPDVATAQVVEALEAVRVELRAIRAMDFADAALGAEGRQVVDPVVRGVLEKVARGDVTADEAVAWMREHVESGACMSAPSLDTPYEAATPEQDAQWRAEAPAKARAKRPGMFEERSSDAGR